MNKTNDVKIVREWSDGDTIGVVLFSDGVAFAFDEKAATLIKGNGEVMETWWRMEPEGNRYYEEFVAAGANGDRELQPVTDEMSSLVFEIGHRGDPISSRAAKTLRRLLN